jgi:hypothetical protein
VALDLPSSPMLGATLAGELETSVIAQTTEINDRMFIGGCSVVGHVLRQVRVDFIGRAPARER